MVRLRVGRFAWELYYTRTKAVLPRQEIKRRLALGLGHLGYITGLLEYIMTDMILLRSFAISGCTMIVGFQLVQPKVQWLSISWNTVYCFVNLFQIHVILRPPPELTEEETELQKATGGRLEARTLRALAELGEWRSFSEGADLTEEGCSGAEAAMHILLSGTCEVRLGDCQVGHLGPGGVVGEAGLVSSTSSTSRAGITVVTRGSVRSLCVPVEALRAQMGREPELCDAMHSFCARSLASKVLEMSKGSKLQQYEAILEVTRGAATDALGELAVSAAVARFKQEAGISDDDHERVSCGLPQNVGQPRAAVLAVAGG
mmetsp:Transcript_8394/g.21457  ORF Transcript_8394/g.21457 Transcript_8394/m.21457 type:complete len:317 (+) Transcript_8394:141-1091(+)